MSRWLSGSFTFSMEASRLSLDALNIALYRAIKQKGDFFVYLQCQLGEWLYSKLCEDADLALEKILYCQEGFGFLGSIPQDDEHGQEFASPAQVQQMRQMKDLINHDYLVLVLRPGDPTAEVVHILAHKRANGIHIEHISSSDVTNVIHEGVHLFTVACCKKRIRLEDLIAILKKEDPDYNLLYANCWLFAKNTAKRLLKACIDTPEISSAEKARLQMEHDNIHFTLKSSQFKSIAMFLQHPLSKVATFLLANINRNSLTFLQPHLNKVSTFAVPLKSPSNGEF